MCLPKLELGKEVETEYQQADQIPIAHSRFQRFRYTNPQVRNAERLLSLVGGKFLTPDNEINHANHKEKAMTTPQAKFGQWMIATAPLVLLILLTSSVLSQNPREWQSSTGTTVVAQLVSQTAEQVQLIDQNGKAYSLSQEKLSDADRRYLKLQDMVRSDIRQFDAVVKQIDTMQTNPEATLESLTKLAKDYPVSPYASLWAGVAMAVAHNDTDRATIHLRDASRRIRDQQKTDPNRHRRTLISCHINLAICFLKKKDAESACEEIVQAFELAKELRNVLRHNGHQLAELSRDGSGLKIPPSLRNKLIAELAKTASQPLNTELQAGWFYSLDLEPAGSLGTELSLIGAEPPAAEMELIATGSGVVCATDHILTVAKAITHPYYKPHLLTAAVPNAEGGWTLMPVNHCEMGDGKSDLALLKVDNLPLTPVTFHEPNGSVSGDISIVGFARGPDILKAGMKSENGSILQSDTQALFFQTTAGLDAGKRGGACIDSSWRVVGINWQRSTEKGARGECYSPSGIHDWMRSNAPTLVLNTAPAESAKEQRESLRKSVVPIFAWQKSPITPNIQIGVLRDEWCIACRGKSIVPCRDCNGVGAIQTGTTKVRAAYNPFNGISNYIEVPTKQACDKCDGRGKVRCTFCEKGKLPGGTGAAKR